MNSWIYIGTLVYELNLLNEFGENGCDCVCRGRWLWSYLLLHAKFANGSKILPNCKQMCSWSEVLLYNTFLFLWGTQANLVAPKGKLSPRRISHWHNYSSKVLMRMLLLLVRWLQPVTHLYQWGCEEAQSLPIPGVGEIGRDVRKNRVVLIRVVLMECYTLWDGRGRGPTSLNSVTF